MSFDPEQIKEFVKVDLGCECPDEIFNSIKHKHSVKIEFDLEVDQTFIIGERLLIIITTVDKKFSKAILKKIIIMGKTWRDDEDLNRFRLVLVSTNPSKTKSTYEPIFKNHPKIDKKMHLHIIDKKVLKKKKYSFLK